MSETTQPIEVGKVDEFLGRFGGDPVGAAAHGLATGDVVTAGGFTGWRRAAQTPFNVVLEARS